MTCGIVLQGAYTYSEMVGVAVCPILPDTYSRSRATEHPWGYIRVYN
jgi:hypothetical protein